MVVDRQVIRGGCRRRRRGSELRLPSLVQHEPVERDAVGDLKVFTSKLSIAWARRHSVSGAFILIPPVMIRAITRGEA